MKVNNRTRLFFKDGLAGFAIEFIIVLVMLAGLWFTIEPAAVDDISHLLRFIEYMFWRSPWETFYFGPMTVVLLTAFVGIGIGGRLLENIKTRKGWIIPILIVSNISWFTAFGFIAITWSWGIFGYWYSLDYVMMAALVGIGACIGFVIATLSGVIFNPSRRLYRLIIGAVASAPVGLSAYVLFFFLFLSWDG